MKKKGLSLFFLMVLVISLFPISVSADKTITPVHIEGRDIIIVGYFDCWLHADGKTWQDTDHDGTKDIPGDGQVHCCELVATIPEDLLSEYENVSYKVVPFSNDMNDTQKEEFFERGGGLFTGQVKPESIQKTCNTFLKFNDYILKYCPTNYHLLEGTNNKVSFIFPQDEDRTLDIKKEWQSQEVQGRRKLLPALVEFYGEKKVIQPPPPQKLSCQNKRKITNTWQELYSWLVPYDCSWTDENGDVHDATCYREESRLVEYSESLSAELTINTKQGIPTDPDNPKGSDRESRGSWEIIPDTQQPIPRYSTKHGINIYGLNPNTVTRAGYGFEIKVISKYETDWETKVPGPASPHGGTYQGPTEAKAEFYNSKGKYVGEVEFEAVKGKPGDYYIEWGMPLRYYTYHDGITIKERKFYTDITDPDGRYLVRIYVDGAGKTGLCLIREEHVYIYGCIWDDIYTSGAK